MLGAGDAFLSGFLRGWLKNEPLETCATYANACGAFAVSRLLCSPEIPTWDELQYFLKHGSTSQGAAQGRSHQSRALGHDPARPAAKTSGARHRSPHATGSHCRQGRRTPRTHCADFKRLAIAAIGKVSKGQPGFGTLLDDTYGREAMFDAAKLGLWIGRPLEQPGSRPLRFEFTQDVGARLAEWPVTHTIKCLAFYHPDDPAELKTEQAQKLRTLYEAARKVGRELLVEIIAGKNGSLKDDTVSRVLAELYALGIKPDWWKLEPQATGAAWSNIEKVIKANDPYCRGIVLLGLEAPEDDLARAFEATAGHSTVKGFAVGRTIFSSVAESWLANKIDDSNATLQMAERFGKLVNVWNKSHA